LAALHLLILGLLQQLLDVTQRTNARFEQLEIFQNVPFAHLPQARRAYAVLGQQVIDKGVHVGKSGSSSTLATQLSAIFQQGLKALIDILILTCETDIEDGEGAQVFELFTSEVEVLVEDGVVRGQLQKLEGEAEKGRRLLDGAVDTTDKLDVLDDAVDYVSLVDSVALLFVEVRVDDALADRLFHDRRRVQAVWGQRAGAAALVEEAPLIGLVKL